MNSEKRLYEYKGEAASAPGDTLKETLDAIGMSQSDLCRRTGLTAKTISGIINGKEPLSQQTALQLETVLGVPASLWNNLERQYQEYRARSVQAGQMRAQKGWLRRFPMRQLLEWAWVERCEDVAQQVLALLRFFGCSSPDQCDTYLQHAAVQYRTSGKFSADEYALSAWLRQGERMGQQLQCSAYDVATFRQALQEARHLSTEKPDEFVLQLQSLCARAGVAVVFVRELPRIRASGATRWLTPDKALIQLDLRHKSNDQLWFSFFHEAGHVLLHGKRQVFVDGQDAEQNELEQQADKFATDMLIPPIAYDSFVQRGHLASSAIMSFAREQGIESGIVVGRLQHDQLIPYNRLNNLKERLAWMPER
ncbi:MAG: helix-turn-helix domain-containing protein [Candidatus Cryosericum sp.]